jgi:hypothetical protein
MARVTRTGVAVLGAVVVGLFSALAPVAVGAQTAIESSSEIRFQLDLKVPEAALDAYLPAGWSPNVATQGAAKDADLRAVFIDRLTVNEPDGRPVGTTGTNRLVYLVAPVREPGGSSVQLVIGGLTEDPADVPGPFSNYLQAATHQMQRAVSNESDTLVETQDWDFSAVSGEHLALHVVFERGVANRGNPSDTMFYSARDPGVFQISHQEQVLDILRNVTTTPPDRVREFTFEGSGGTYAPLFDGTEQVLSWDNIVWINRSVTVP